MPTLIVTTALLGVHGLIHLIGVFSAFGKLQETPFQRPITPAQGLAWGLAAVLFLIASALRATARSEWWMVALVAAGLSQILILFWWEDARYGTLPNLIILALALLAARERGKGILP